MSIEGCADRIMPEKDLYDMDLEELKTALKMVSCTEGCAECEGWVRMIQEAIDSYENRQAERMKKVLKYRRENGIPEDGIIKDDNENEG